MKNLMRAIMTGVLVAVPLAGPASATDAMPASEATATMVCRAAEPNEHATAMTTADKKPLVCKPVAGMMKAEPKMKPGMTAKQVDDGWRNFVGNVFAVSVYDK